MVDIQFATTEIRRGKKEGRRRKKPQGKNIMACPIPYSGRNNVYAALVIVVPFLEFTWFIERMHT